MNWFNNLFKKEDRRTKAYCICGHEIFQDPYSRIFDAGTHLNIICSVCNAQTSWDVGAPVPLFLKDKTIL